MQNYLLFKLAFYLLALATLLCNLKQCNQGRLSEAFAIADAGIRADQEIIENELQRTYNYFSSSIAIYSNSEDQKRLGRFQKLRTAQLEYDLLLEQVRTKLLKAAGLSAVKPLSEQALVNARDVVKEGLLSGQTNTLMQIAERTRMLRTSMIAAADSDYAVIVNLPLGFSAAADGRYVFNGISGNFRDCRLLAPWRFYLIYRFRATSL